MAYLFFILIFIFIFSRSQGFLVSRVSRSQGLPGNALLEALPRARSRFLGCEAGVQGRGGGGVQGKPINN